MGRPKKNRDADAETTSRATEARDYEARALQEREALSDNPESALYVPPSEWPAGKTYRWVRIEANGAADNKNWSQMTRVGWSPVPRSRHANRFPVVPMPGVGDITEGTIVYGGLCLCERDTALVMRDKQRQIRETIAQNDSIKGYVEGGNSNMPRFNQSGPVQYEGPKGTVAFKE